MAEKVTAYMCNKSCGKIECMSVDDDIETVEIVDETIKTALWPEVEVRIGKITAQLQKEGDSKYVCFPVDDLLTWEREEIPYGGEPVGLYDYITIEIENSSHCHWIQSYILFYGADGSIFGRIFGFVDVGSGGQACPSDKNDVFSGGGKTQFHLTQNTAVPGELIILGWAFWDGQHTEQIEVDAEWLCTCCFTGGTVESINGEHGDIDITYTVEIQGVNRTCVSSDFVEYEVGDWVFVLVPNSTCAENGRKVACKGGCGELGNYTILPLRIGDYGP